MEVEAAKQALLRSERPGIVRLREKRPRAAEPAAGPTCVGVFAARRIQVNEELGEYSGELTRLSAGAQPSCFAFQLDDRVAVDPAALNGSNPVRLSQVCIAHFVDQPQPEQRCTARFLIDQESSRVTLRSIIEMDEGEEVLASYGDCRPTSKQHAVNEPQCSRFAPVVALTRTEQQRLALASDFAATACDFAAGGVSPDGGKGTTAAVKVRVVQRVAPVVRRRLVKPATASRPRTIDRWTREEIEELADLILRHGSGQWKQKVAALTTSLPGVTRTAAAAAYVWHAKLKSQQRFAHLLDSGALRADGTAIGWSEEERQTLIALVADTGSGARDWKKKAKMLGTGRTANAVKMYYKNKIRPQQQARTEPVLTLQGPPEILEMKAQDGRKLYLTALPPPTVSSRGRRRKITPTDPSRAEAKTSDSAPDSRWWATAEELIELVGTENAEAMITKLIEFASNSSEPGVESDESDEDLPIGQSNWSYQAWKAGQSPLQLQQAQRGTRARRVRRLENTRAPTSAEREASNDDNDNDEDKDNDDDTDDVPLATLAVARFSPSASASASPSADSAPTRTPRSKRRVWTQEELSKLKELVKEQGEGNWDSKAVALGTGRTGTSLKMKYYMYSLPESSPSSHGRDGKEVERKESTQSTDTAGPGSTAQAVASAATIADHPRKHADEAAATEEAENDATNDVVAVHTAMVAAVDTAATEHEIVQTLASAPSVAKGGIGTASGLQGGPSGSKQEDEPSTVEQVKQEDSQEQEQPLDNVDGHEDDFHLPVSFPDEVGAESNPPQHELSVKEEEEQEEEEDKQQEEEEEEEEEEEDKHHQQVQQEEESQLGQRNKEGEHDVSLLSKSSEPESSARDNEQDSSNPGAATESALRDWESPPPSRVAWQLLLSDSDSPEILEGSPSPLNGTSSSTDSDTPAALAAEISSACTYDTKQHSPSEIEALSPSSSARALVTAGERSGNNKRKTTAMSGTQRARRHHASSYGQWEEGGLECNDKTKHSKRTAATEADTSASVAICDEAQDEASIAAKMGAIKGTVPVRHIL